MRVPIYICIAIISYGYNMGLKGIQSDVPKSKSQAPSLTAKVFPTTWIVPIQLKVQSVVSRFAQLAFPQSFDHTVGQKFIKVSLNLLDCPTVADFDEL